VAEQSRNLEAAHALAPESPLHRLAALAGEAGATEIASEVIALADRLVEGRFYVVCLGQFKRGKSTLLNALTGTMVLPTGVAPVTSVVTVMRHGPRLAARVRIRGASWMDIEPASLASYVSERENPENARAVEAVEIFVPSPLLACGMCLVDTPGIGSTLAGNTAMTRAFVPQIDAALVVLGADPPISGEELALIAEVATRVDALIFVLNKADRLSHDERREARAFTQRVLADRLGRRPPPLLEVSAKERMEGAGDPRDWPTLTSTLETLARDAGSSLLEGAEERGLTLFVEQLVRDLDEQRNALVRPTEESERRISQLKATASEAERAMLELRYLLDAEQDRLVERLMAQCERFVARAVPGARAELAAAVADLVEIRRRDLRQRSFELAQDIYRRWLDRWRNEEQPSAEQLYRNLARRFLELANGFLDRVAMNDAGIPPRIANEDGFRRRSRLHYTEMLHLTSRSPVEWLVERFRWGRAAQNAMEREVGDYLEHLITTNASRLIYDLRERIVESRRQLEARIRTSLRAVYASAERALEQARAHHAAGAKTVRRQLDRIDELRRRCEALRIEHHTDKG
jgi:GTP-binding protein EngB required for normal cell division